MVEEWLGQGKAFQEIPFPFVSLRSSAWLRRCEMIFNQCCFSRAAQQKYERKKKVGRGNCAHVVIKVVETIKKFYNKCT